MNEENLTDITNTLKELSEKVNTNVEAGNVIPKAWHTPYVSEQELVNFPFRIAKKLSEIELSDIDEELSEQILSQIEKIKELELNVVPHLFNSNARYAVPSYLESLRSLESILTQILSWESIDNPNTMPKNLAKRIKSIDAQIKKIEPDIDSLKDKIDSINDASDTAEKLPIDLQSLKDANIEIEKVKDNSTKHFLKIQNTENEATKLKESINQQEERAKKVANYCDEVHGIATSVGLSASFTERANKTSTSMYFWIGSLFVALTILMVLGYNRLESFNELTKVENPNWGAMWMNLFLSVIGIAAPGWLAWISTKQISQRFKIAEDYKYKAAVAKAYEGYKKEVTEIDSDLAYRLFDSTLTRLEEPPLRLMEKENHGSPLNEFLNSPHMEKIVSKIPQVNDVLNELKGIVPTKSQEKEKNHEE